jgi:hypothetical protein
MRSLRLAAAPVPQRCTPQHDFDLLMTIHPYSFPLILSFYVDLIYI